MRAMVIDPVRGYSIMFKCRFFRISTAVAVAVAAGIYMTCLMQETQCTGAVNFVCHSYILGLYRTCS